MKHISYLILFACLLTGCKDFLDVELPVNETITETVFSTDETATSALMGSYYSMMDQNRMPYTFSLYCGVSADELVNYYSIADLKTLYDNHLLSNNTYVGGCWSNVYNIIYQANNIYEGCLASKGMSMPVKRQIMGETLFMRAFWHFNLTNLF